MVTQPRAAVILAAGQGTRMKSALPKVLHRLAGRTLIDHAIDAVQGLGCERTVVVVGAHSPEVRAHVAARLGEDAIAVQDPPRGTGHAVLAAKSALADFAGDVVVTYGDHPLFTADVIAPLFDLRGAGADMAVLGFEPADAARYGRLVLNGGALEKIIEAADATPAQLAIRACNTGVLAAPASLLFELLGRVGNDNAKGEYYLTDVVGLANAAGRRVHVAFAPEERTLGVNSQGELAAAEAAFQRRRRSQLMDDGVTMVAPDTVYLAWDTAIAPGAVIEPNVIFASGVTVEAGAVIRAFSHLEGAAVRAGAIVGPYARLRPGADIGEDAHIGNFVEVKKVKVGRGAKANHLAYLGDGSIGPGANIGAGTIFCNYDGFDKFDTHVGEGAFIGSNSALVAPVTVGPGAYTGSGSVITRDVAENALALGRGQQVEKPGWAMAFRERKMRERAKK
ncbi:MAG TPA: bifunctional UDP-N-acetylglucosamine diphosphorylase/glucosamine-1-phosphate N-acetyltransferase GlmU [Caulobacteraceae bacterium]|nr:bifunctional UDP-N-acetylglucosamine diphosphorylase/glucosamine-1-phosphate N-acetyltransferase GlmU [Caulobacteraceae bacterium]